MVGVKEVVGVRGSQGLGVLGVMVWWGQGSGDLGVLGVKVIKV